MNPSTEAQMAPSRYVTIWMVLVAALFVSILVARMQLPVVTVLLIFSVAVMKAWLVVAYYMHLKLEPYWVIAILASSMLCLYVLFVGLTLDIVFQPGTTAVP